MSIAIKIENLSKQYRLGLVNTRTLSHDLNRWWQMNIRGKDDPYLKIGDTNDRATRGVSDYVWALKDIDLEIQEGEILGIIGKNGAGKSTLLKILSKVTSPTTGSIKAKGRIASLLEVGTGFHAEMTGRENIFLNGAILGMTKIEIRKKFDEIVDFAGVERYIDTPVKRYSSGMLVRLGFAVAAHLEPEILVVDEVLAVGDAEFQKKAIGKMQDISKGEGRTVLFVSHNLQSISTLTSQCILMEHGEITFSGSPEMVIDRYLLINIDHESLFVKEPDPQKPSITKIEIKTFNSGNIHVNGQPLEIVFDLHTPFPLRGASFSFQVVNNKNDQPIVHLWTFDSERPMCRQPGTYTLHCLIPKSRIYMGEYSLKAYFTGPPGGDRYHILEGVCPFKVEMYSVYREFQFVHGTCTYIEDAIWKIENHDF
jgi:lipopolysaccharide transport system ATP-binding protein